jgi:metal-responsive CopG/Arc/MetJ family transcriptional regulator
METVAVTLDRKTLNALDAVSAASTRKAGGRPNRSLVVRTAVQEYVERQLRLESEERERLILAKHRGKLAKAAAALVRGQARL